MKIHKTSKNQYGNKISLQTYKYLYTIFLNLKKYKAGKNMEHKKIQNYVFGSFATSKVVSAMNSVKDQK